MIQLLHHDELEERVGSLEQQVRMAEEGREETLLEHRRSLEEQRQRTVPLSGREAIDSVLSKLKGKTVDGQFVDFEFVSTMHSGWHARLLTIMNSCQML